MADYQFTNEGGEVTVSIDGGPSDGIITGCNVQTAEGTDNILAPCIYSAATIRMLTADSSVYKESFIGSEVEIDANTVQGEKAYNLLSRTDDPVIGAVASTNYANGILRKSGTGSVAIVTVDDSPISKLTKAIRLTRSGTSKAVNIGFAYDGCDLAAGTYTFSCWIKGAKGIYCLMQGYWKSASDRSQYGFYKQTDGWEYFSYTFTTTVDKHCTVAYVYIYGANNETVDVIGMMFESGSIAHSWDNGEDYSVSKNLYHWHGRVISNCANMDYNQDREEIEIQAVDDLTLAKSYEYDGATFATPMAILGACLPDLTLAFDPSLVALSTDGTTTQSIFNGDWCISLAGLVPTDASGRLTRADVMEAVLRYLSCRALGMAKTDEDEPQDVLVISTNEGRKTSQDGWLIYKHGGEVSTAAITFSALTLGGTDAPYRGTVQVSLLDPYKSYEITAKFPGVEIEDESYTECGRDEYQTKSLNGYEADPACTVGWMQKYKQGSQSEYKRWQYTARTLSQMDSGLTDLDASRIYDGYPVAQDAPTEYNVSVTSNDSWSDKTTEQTFTMGAIHVESAVKALEDDATPKGVPSYTEALMFYGVHGYSFTMESGIPFFSVTSDKVVRKMASSLTFTPLYSRTISALFLSSETYPAYLIVNGDILYSYCDASPFLPSGITNNTRSMAKWRWAWGTGYIPMRVILRGLSGPNTAIDTWLAYDFIEDGDKPYNKSWNFDTDVLWSDNVSTDGHKLKIPSGVYSSVTIQFGPPSALIYSNFGVKSNVPIAGNYSAYVYVKNLEFAIENANPDAADAETNTVYGWNNEALQIDGNEVTEETNISTYDGKNLSPVCTASVNGDYLTTIQNTISGTDDCPEQLRVDAYAKQYESSTFEMVTTLGGAPNMLATYEHGVGGTLTVESYNYNLATNLTEVTLVNNKI